MWTRLAAVTALILLPGCAECGPELWSIGFYGHFVGTYTQANRTAADRAWLDLGFTPDPESANGWVREGTEGTFTVVARNETVTEMQWRIERAHREYSSVDEARADGLRQAQPYWSSFNNTLTSFAQRTNWTILGPTTNEAHVVIC